MASLLPKCCCDALPYRQLIRCLDNVPVDLWVLDSDIDPDDLNAVVIHDDTCFYYSAATVEFASPPTLTIPPPFAAYDDCGPCLVDYPPPDHTGDPFVCDEDTLPDDKPDVLAIVQPGVGCCDCYTVSRNPSPTGDQSWETDDSAVVGFVFPMTQPFPGDYIYGSLHLPSAGENGGDVLTTSKNYIDSSACVGVLRNSSNEDYNEVSITANVTCFFDGDSFAWLFSVSSLTIAVGVGNMFDMGGAALTTPWNGTDGLLGTVSNVLVQDADCDAETSSADGPCGGGSVKFYAVRPGI